MLNEDDEDTFVEELRRYEHKWVAIRQLDGSETIVGSGLNAVEAIRDAEAKGFYDTVLFKVPPSNKGYIPLGRLSRFVTSNLPR
jgi:hypothetical protein